MVTSLFPGSIMAFTFTQGNIIHILAYMLNTILVPENCSLFTCKFLSNNISSVLSNMTLLAPQSMLGDQHPLASSEQT